MSSPGGHWCHSFRTCVFYNLSLVNNVESLEMDNPLALRTALKRSYFPRQDGWGVTAAWGEMDALFPVFLYPNRFAVGWFKRHLSQAVFFKCWPWTGLWDDLDTAVQGKKALLTQQRGERRLRLLFSCLRESPEIQQEILDWAPHAGL